MAKQPGPVAEALSAAVDRQAELLRKCGNERYALVARAKELTERIGVLERLLKNVEENRKQESALLRLALHELAGERGSKDHLDFVRDWLDAKRLVLDPPELPFKEMPK